MKMLIFFLVHFALVLSQKSFTDQVDEAWEGLEEDILSMTNIIQNKKNLIFSNLENFANSGQIISAMNNTIEKAIEDIETSVTNWNFPSDLNFLTSFLTQPEDLRLFGDNMTNYINNCYANYLTENKQFVTVYVETILQKYLTMKECIREVRSKCKEEYCKFTALSMIYVSRSQIKQDVLYVEARVENLINNLPLPECTDEFVSSPILYKIFVDETVKLTKKTFQICDNKGLGFEFLNLYDPSSIGMLVRLEEALDNAIDTVYTLENSLNFQKFNTMNLLNNTLAETVKIIKDLPTNLSQSPDGTSELLLSSTIKNLNFLANIMSDRLDACFKNYIDNKKFVINAYRNSYTAKLYIMFVICYEYYYNICVDCEFPLLARFYAILAEIANMIKEIDVIVSYVSTLAPKKCADEVLEKFNYYATDIKVFYTDAYSMCKGGF